MPKENPEVKSHSKPKTRIIPKVRVEYNTIPEENLEESIQQGKLIKSEEQKCSEPQSNKFNNFFKPTINTDGLEEQPSTGGSSLTNSSKNIKKESKTPLYKIQKDKAIEFYGSKYTKFEPKSLKKSDEGPKLNETGHFVTNNNYLANKEVMKNQEEVEQKPLFKKKLGRKNIMISSPDIKSNMQNHTQCKIFQKQDPKDAQMVGSFPRIKNSSSKIVNNTLSDEIQPSKKKYAIRPPTTERREQPTRVSNFNNTNKRTEFNEKKKRLHSANKPKITRNITEMNTRNISPRAKKDKNLPSIQTINDYNRVGNELTNIMTMAAERYYDDPEVKDMFGALVHNIYEMKLVLQKKNMNDCNDKRTIDNTRGRAKHRQNASLSYDIKKVPRTNRKK